MRTVAFTFRVAALAALFTISGVGLNADPAPPTISLGVSGGQKTIQFKPYPAADKYQIWKVDALGLPAVEDTSGTFGGFKWTSPLSGTQGFFQLGVVPMPPERLAAATVLNRLAYGPTPDELDRVLAMGVDAYIAEQLAPESITETLDDLGADTNGWVHVVQTGTASSSTLYIYLSGAGTAYLDDIRLVSGTDITNGVNVLANGDFESALTGPWTVSTNLTPSTVTTETAHSGTSSLKIVATAGGSSQTTAIWQTVARTLTANATYTLSYWYKRASNGAALTVRLSGSGILTTPDATMAGLANRLNLRQGGINELRSWFLLHGVHSKKQLLEVMTQFLENHFVTEYSKTVNYLDTYYDDFNVIGMLSADFEYREVSKWRAALSNPGVTFYDLLKISAESPAMIVYLDTVNSKGNGSNVANENYARELLELFTYGVDNGYDQTDITIMSRAWTGWSLEYVDLGSTNNPFAPRTTVVAPGVTNNFNAISNLVGSWSFVFKQANHNTNSKTIFPNKTAPARFGSPWAGKSYQLVLPSRNGTNGISDGYDVIKHLANQPFTEEFISVKLCRLFVHDDFATGYDFTSPDLSPEGQLVKQCMLAWESSSPKGQMRPVLNTIFNSALFRGHGGSRQKIKTPMEFVVSGVRAILSGGANGGTASTDGVSLQTAMTRMGLMNLFDRDSPDGYPESGPPWISAGTLAERLRWAQALLINPSQNGHADAGNSSTDPVALIQKKLPQASWTDASAVADYFITLLYPGEGKANLEEYHTLAVKFLNTADDGVSTSLFTSQSTAGSPSPYDTRVRGMVGMLMTLPRFQEQ